MKRRPIKRRRRKNGNAGLIATLVATVALALFVWLLTTDFFQGSAVVTRGEIAREYMMEGVVVRSERLFDSDGAANLTYSADEGSLVDRGSQIAQVYSPSYSQTEMTRLNAIEEQIKQYYLTLESEGYADSTLTRLNTSINDLTLQLQNVAQGRSTANALSLERQIARQLTERMSYLKQKYPNDTRLESYYNEEKTQRKRIESWTVSYIADTTAIVSFYTDGYERTLTPEFAQTMNAADIRSVLAGTPPELTAAERSKTPVYRLIEPRGFYVSVISSDKYWNPQGGNSCRIMIEGIDDIIYDAYILSSSRVNNDLVVRLRVEASVADILSIRTAKFRVAEPPVSGLVVPAECLYTKDGQIGVVLGNSERTFIAVSVVARDSKQAVVEPTYQGAIYEGIKVKKF